MLSVTLTPISRFLSTPLLTSSGHLGIRFSQELSLRIGRTSPLILRCFTSTHRACCAVVRSVLSQEPQPHPRSLFLSNSGTRLLPSRPLHSSASSYYRATVVPSKPHCHGILPAYFTRPGLAVAHLLPSNSNLPRKQFLNTSAPSKTALAQPISDTMTSSDTWQAPAAQGKARLITEALEKPLLDDRSYRVIQLANEMEVLLVHDPKADKASASMDVNVGNFSDEVDMPGMAHAVEHVRIGFRGGACGVAAAPMPSIPLHRLGDFFSFFNVLTLTRLLAPLYGYQKIPRRERLLAVPVGELGPFQRLHGVNLHQLLL